ncbi:MAG: 3'-5' exonuclease [Aggregatilineales bacterium]
MSQLLEGLNPQQLEAVTAPPGPVLVLAGPGSGKTRVLTYRIAYLIQEMGVQNQAILAVTFTNKAAGEMRARAERLLGNPLRGLHLGTFHSICARLLRREGDHTPYGSEYVIYDTDDQLAVIQQAMNELNVDPKKFRPRGLLGAISTAKNELVVPSQFQSSDYFGEIVSRVYPRYQSILLDNNAMDFDDLMMQMTLLLRENEAIHEKYQHLFQFVMVDEFQDTNIAQYELIRLLGMPDGNVFVVGDEDQGIYGFRGADSRNVALFRQDYPNTKVVLLEQNYRSTQIVLDAARAVIDKNPNRTPKALFTDRAEGDKISLHEAYSEDYEARFVVDKIDEMCRKKGLDYKDFAVMYRTNAQSRALEEACIREGIPYVLIGGVGFYKRREVRDILAYLRIINNNADKISFSRIINVPRRGIGKKSLADFQLWAAQECDNYDDALGRLINGETSPLSSRSARMFADFGLTLRSWREIAAQGDLVELFDRIMSDTGYRMYMIDTLSDTEDQALEREENLNELRGLLSQAKDEGITLSEFLAEQSLVADVDALSEESSAVTLLTLHAAKGLEFPVVFITGLEEGVLPHIRAFEELDGMSEERRLLYVGITRAEDYLYLTYAFRRSLYGSTNANTPSRFLADLPQHLVEGLSAKIAQAGNQQKMREQSRWNSSQTDWTGGQSRLQRDLEEARQRDLERNASSSLPSAPEQPEHEANERVRSKIVPFPSQKSTKFSANQRVKHNVFGYGMVIEAKRAGDDEIVVVAFENKAHGIKRITADYLTQV